MTAGIKCRIAMGQAILYNPRESDEKNSTETQELFETAEQSRVLAYGAEAPH
jgi:hypothetical protein